MRLARFRLRTLVMPVSAVSLVLATLVLQAREKDPADPPRADPQDVDVASRAMKREVAAKRKQMDEIFVRLRANQPPPEAPRPVVVERIGAVQFFPPAQVTQRSQLYEFVPLEGANDRIEGGGAVLPLRVQVYTEEAFDLMLFGKSGTELAEETWARLNKVLDAFVDHETMKHKLTVHQQDKLRLAGRGDIKRLLDRIEERRRQWKQVRMNRREAQVFLMQSRGIQNESVMGSFRDGSLFAKVLQRILEERGTAGLGPER